MPNRITPHQSMQNTTKVVLLCLLAAAVIAVFGSCIAGRYTHYDGCKMNRGFVGYK